MVEERTFENGRVNIRYHALSQREIVAMSNPRLTEHLAYIDRQLTLWNQPTFGLTEWIRKAAQTWRNALQSEKRRVLKELARREELNEASDCVELR